MLTAAAALAALGLLVSACCAGAVRASTADLRGSAADAPHRPVALVLGAGLDPSGRPGPFLERRLDLAAELYTSERVDAVLVSGDNSRAGYNETDAMAGHLAGAGVPRGKIAADYAGFSTWESCARAADVFGVEAATVVSQSFHVPRAVALCRAAGIDVRGVGDPSRSAFPIDTVYGHLREVPASVTAAAEILFQPDPTFPGPPESAVDDALAHPR
ncbi:ElyC/SanA/YdcF family protein [Nocardiopsis coralliicola]